MGVMSVQVVRFRRARREGDGALNLIYVLSLILAGLAVIGVFIDIPVVSTYAFWILLGAYIILAGSRN